MNATGAGSRANKRNFELFTFANVHTQKHYWRVKVNCYILELRYRFTNYLKNIFYENMQMSFVHTNKLGHHWHQQNCLPIIIFKENKLKS